MMPKFHLAVQKSQTGRRKKQIKWKSTRTVSIGNTNRNKKHVRVRSSLDTRHNSDKQYSLIINYYNLRLFTYNTYYTPTLYNLL